MLLQHLRLCLLNTHAGNSFIVAQFNINHLAIVPVIVVLTKMVFHEADC